MEMQNRFTWFKDWVGVSEQEFLANREQFIRTNETGLSIVNPKNSNIWDAGCFSVHSISSLLSQVTTSKKTKYPKFEIIVRTTDEAKPHVDVAYLQSCAQPKSMFQVASNFNCAEVPSNWTDMAGGRFVSNNALDHTQGPAASASAGISLLTRIHAPFFNENTEPSTWGQCFDRQVELLGDEMIRDHFPVENGKLIFKGSEPRHFDPSDDFFRAVRIGVHVSAPVYFGRREQSKMEISNPVPIIDQVFVAALNKKAPLPYPEHLESKSRFLLRAAYEGTYLAAIMQKSENLVLTLIGGGVFGNPLAYIAASIAQAHHRWANMSQLQCVQLPLYPLQGEVRGENMVELLCMELLKVGIPEDTIHIKEVHEFLET